MSKGTLAKRPTGSISKGPTINSFESGAFTALAILGSTTLLGFGAHYYLKEKRVTNIPPMVRPAVQVDFNLAQGNRAYRKEYLNSLSAKLGKDFPAVIAACYDPEWTQSFQYSRFLVQQYFPNSESSYKLTSTEEDMRVPILENLLGTGRPSPIFFGDEAFEKGNEADLISLFKTGAREAEIFAKGYHGIDNTWLASHINSGLIPQELVTTVRKFDALLHGMSTPGMSLGRQKELESKMEALQAILAGYAGYSSEPMKQFLLQSLGFYDLKVLADLKKEREKKKNKKNLI